jgi:tripeptide aminopeptidase
MNVTDRFLKYVKFDTKSDENTGVTPSTPGQMVFAKYLKEELEALGLTEITLDDNAYLMATLPANTDEDIPTIGFIAHLDTSPDMSGENVNPQMVDYKGGDITLNADKGIVLSPTQFPELNDYVGETLITTDGTTLLGADDKAGVAEIVTAMEWLVAHPEVEHGKIRVGFTPDEEIGRGVDYFDVQKFGADFAYTMDGGMEGELEYENFNAAGAKIVISGRNVHPGMAKNKMINAIDIATELNGLLPASERPQFTENYEGFFHCVGIHGSVEEAEINYIIRDHDSDKFEQKKQLMWDVVNFLQRKYGEQVLTLTLKDQYYNMRKMVEPHPQVIDKARRAMIEAGVKPLVRPIRGGTDGSRLSFMGLPCPNIFTGGMNFHGRYEYASLTTMNRAMNTIINLARIWAE